MAVLGEYGSGQYRFGGTLGHEFSTLSQIKITAERLGQRLPFQFQTGNVEQRVHQDAYGLQFRQLFEQRFLQAFNVGGYYAKAANKELAPIQFISNGINCVGYGAGLYCVNYRNIAGATSEGVDVGAELLLTPRTFIAGNLYYDRVRYNTDLTGSSSENRQGLGGGIQFKQLFAENLELAGEASVRELYNVYQIGINWLPFKESRS